MMTSMTTPPISTGNTPEGHPTLLMFPPWFGVREELVLPLPADAYEIKERQREWFEVRERATDRLIYSGLGPVSVIVSRAPF